MENNMENKMKTDVIWGIIRPVNGHGVRLRNILAPMLNYRKTPMSTLNGQFGTLLVIDSSSYRAL